MKLSESNKLDIINKYTVDLVPMIALAKEYGVNRSRIYQIITGAGIDTAKRRIPVSCTVCGKEVLRPRCQVRKTKRMFCSAECYHAFLENKQSRYWRHGQRLARAAVAAIFDLQPGQIVHHKDGNQAHNDLSNLAVFANQGDHIRFHRGFDAAPVWEG